MTSLGRSGAALKAEIRSDAGLRAMRASVAARVAMDGKKFMPEAQPWDPRDMDDRLAGLLSELLILPAFGLLFLPISLPGFAIVSGQDAGERRRP